MEKPFFGAWRGGPILAFLLISGTSVKLELIFIDTYIVKPEKISFCPYLPFG
jgi:hypothetical protein